MSAQSERQIIAAYQEQQIALRGAAQSTVEAAWNGLGSYNAADVQPFVDAIRPVVTAAQQHAASMTDGYIATLGAEVTGEPAQYAGLDPADYVGAAVRNGTPFDEEYRRPFVQVWSDLAGGVQWTDAVIRGARRLGLLADTDVSLSSRAAARDAMDADHRIVGYRRVLTGFRSCRFCAVASTQRYHKGDLMPLHSSCDCVVAAIWGTEDPGRIINRDLLNKLRHDSDRRDYWNEHGFVDEHGNPVTSPKKIQAANRDVTVKEHGELGPTLVSDKHHFTGPKQIKAAEKRGKAAAGSSKDEPKSPSKSGKGDSTPSGSGGGGSGSRRSPSSAGFPDENSSNAARRIRAAAEEHEPQITQDIKDALVDGARLEGIEYRLKERASLEDKIRRSVELEGKSLETAAAEINDAVRYTETFAANEYTDKVGEALDALRAKGYRVTDYTNTWGDGTAPYKALNVTLESPDGQLIEVQFHTPEGYRTNKLTHDWYRERRNPATPQARKDQLRKKSAEAIKDLQDPLGAASIRPG